ncbi:hypothetical protein C4569_03780, partial [Candidatus Parcubacteria bacterium]
MSKLIKKAFTVSVVMTTIIWSIGLFAMPLSVLAVGSGDLIKKASSSSLYYLGADGKRYVFPSSREYNTWYDDFSGVTVVSDAELDSYPLGGNVTVRPGVKLVQAVTNDTPWQVADSKVYAVAENGTLRHISSAAVAVSLYGSSWESSIIPVVETVFVGYTTGSAVSAAADYDKAAETAAASSINVDKGLSTDGSGSSLTCSLAADTPASTIAFESAARVPFTYVNCTASADGDVVIDSLTVERSGAASADGIFSSIALIDRDTEEQIGLNKSLNSSHQATINDDITVSAGTTKKLALTGNMAASLDAYAGQVPFLSLAAMTLSGSSTLSATLPITGNYQTVNTTVVIGSGTLGTGPSNPSTDGAPEIGKANVEFTEIKISNTASSSTNPSGLKVKQIKFTQNGSASDSDIEDLDLVDQDATVLATVQQSDKKAVFTFAAGSEPTINAGMNRSYMIRGDVEGGSARTVDFDVKNYTDILVYDPDHSSYVTLTAGTGAASSSPYINGQAHTIGNGTLKIEPATLLSTNIAEGSTQQLLGKFKFTVKGERVDITSIGWKTTLTKATDGSSSSTTDITNITIYDPDGNIVAGPQDFSTTEIVAATVVQATATTTDTITVPIGETIYTIKGDLSTDLNTNDTIKMTVKPGQITSTGEVSGNTITPTPTTEQDSVTQTVKAGALNVSLSPLPIAASVVKGTQNYTFANVVIDASASSEDVKITQVKVSVKPSTNAAANELSSMKMYDGATELSVSNDPDSGLSSTNDTDSTSTFTLSSPLLITKGTSKTL